MVQVSIISACRTAVSRSTATTAPVASAKACAPAGLRFQMVKCASGKPALKASSKDLSNRTRPDNQNLLRAPTGANAKAAIKAIACSFPLSDQMEINQLASTAHLIIK